jgi:hypothetical protein
LSYKTLPKLMTEKDPSESPTSKYNEALGNSGEIAVSGGVQILSLVGAILAGGSGIAISALGVSGAFLLGTWQTEQQKKFIEEVKQKLSFIDQTKLDTVFLESDEFKEVVIRILDETKLVTSALRRDALARGLINSVFLPSSKLTGKLAFIRLISHITDEELQVLGAMENAWIQSIPLLDQDHLQQWLKDLSLEQIQEACLGLQQQRLLDYLEPDTWGLSILGKKLVVWLSGEEEKENFEQIQQTYLSKLKEDMDLQMRKVVIDELHEYSLLGLESVNA